MKEFEQHQEKKLNDLENKFQTKLEHMMQKVMNDFKDSMTKVMNSMTTQLKRIQSINLQQFPQMMQPTLTTNNLSTDKKLNDSAILTDNFSQICQGKAQKFFFTYSKLDIIFLKEKWTLI